MWQRTIKKKHDRDYVKVEMVVELPKLKFETRAQKDYREVYVKKSSINKRRL